MNTLRELTFQPRRYFQVIGLSVGVVDIHHRLLNIIVPTLQYISCRTIGVVVVVGEVSRIDVVPVDLRGSIITALPQVHQLIVLSCIHRWTYPLPIVPDATHT